MAFGTPPRRRTTIPEAGTDQLWSVALALPASDGVLTYRVPAGLGEPSVGRRVVVPLGKRLQTGVLLEPAPASPDREVRDAVRLLDDGPLLTAEILALVRWAAAHYLAPFGPAVKAALPPGIDVKEAQVPALTAEGRAQLERGQLALPGQEDPQHALLLQVAARRRVARPALEKLVRAGLVALQREEAPARASVPTLELVRATGGTDALARAPRQAALLSWVLARGGTVPADELLAAFPGARAQLRALRARGAVELFEVEAGPARVDPAFAGGPAVEATPSQARAIAALREALDARAFAPFLLQGVTGSGKTWVYLEAIAHARALGLGGLVLVPEIALTPQLAGRFRARFGDDVAVLHSGLTDGERLAEWRRVRDGRAGIVVGARSAVWAPVERLGLVVVDEEHEPSYKQEERLRYHARDLALVRAQRAGAAIVLGSATPSLETLRRAAEGKLRVLTLPTRVDGRAPPQLEVVRRPVSESLFTPELAGALRETLERREQTILFLNRRGHTRTLLCTRCGAAVGCPNCSVALVLHRAGRERLRCHLCGHDEAPRAQCAACGGRALSPVGGGTERVEEELLGVIPGARVARLDRDSASGPGQAAAVLARFARRELDVLVGTQMVAKGHDFPGVTLVGVLDADGPLQLPDFRAAERAVQLLVQVAGRAGRGDQPGRVLVQAYRPEEPAIAAASDYPAFARDELARRDALGFPPFSRLAKLTLLGNSEPRVRGAAERLARAARGALIEGEGASVLGPAPAPLAKIRGKHRFQLLLRAADHRPLHRLLHGLVQRHRDAGPPGVELAVDVDPVALL